MLMRENDEPAKRVNENMKIIVHYPETPEKQAQYGVLAIEVERIRLSLEMLNGTYTVRLLTTEDIPEMLRVAQSNPLFYRYMRPDPNVENLGADLAALPPRRTIADKHFFGWFDGERLVGMMDLINHRQAQSIIITSNDIIVRESVKKLS